MLLGWFIAGYGYAQIRGGAETARFEPGDRILYQEDLSGTPIGSQVEGWEILQGSYEVAEFQDRRWFRPLAYNTHILRRMDFPQDFSVEFTTYLFEPGEAELRVFLHTEEDIKRGVGPDGYAQVYLKIFRTGNRDGFWFATWNATNRRWQVVVEDPRRLPPDTPHNVALQVRGGRLNLFIDGERVATTPFRPDAPLRAISFRFLSRKGHELPYKDRPALLDGIRIAGYSRPVGRATGGVFLYWMFPGGQENLPQLQAAQNQTISSSTALDALGGEPRTVEGTLVPVDLPANPFAPGEVRVRAEGQAWQAFVRRLRADLEAVRQAGGGLIIVGDGGDGRTERERRLLANQRAIAFAAWLARQGIGNPQNLLSIVADNGGYESIFFVVNNGGYRGIVSLRMQPRR
ncbi:MAG TPA: hypothetical protein DCM56_01070 [Thermus sp.]|jgi:hypothetical protein|uniref:Uncharacterized protein n=2 Tax=Thermaceae TaxID=188786 RepID=Q53WG3_THET8|nr:hypothetical protein [Thermus thermophilus HB8]HAH39444.1 hypothetical protein [Thermus sp.]